MKLWVYILVYGNIYNYDICFLFCSQTRKRSAPNSDDEGVAKPAKRATVDTLSPTEEAPPTIELPAESANGLSKNKSSDSTCSVTSNER